MIKKYAALFIFSGCLLNIAACSPFVMWKEEVKLNDGRVVVVEQKKLVDHGIAREAWLTLNLPEFSDQPIVWHEFVSPIVLNIDGGHLYIVGDPPTPVEIRKYDCPKHAYVGFVWENKTWKRIPFERIPVDIYDANMLIANFPQNGTSFMTLDKKNSKEENGDARIHGLLKIDPNRGNWGCTSATSM